MSFTDFIWLFLLLSFLTPMLQQRWIEAQRIRLIHKIEQVRKSRVITLIHRQESLAFLGITFARFIDIEDSEALLRAVRLTPDDMPIDLILHTPGGLVLAAELIAEALIRHKAPVTVMIPHYAMSGGTLVALAADEILMDRNAVLGPVDPQVGEYPAASIVEVVNSKPIENIEDKTLILASVARKALAQVRHTVVGILTGNGMAREKAEELAELLATGHWTHDYPIDFEQAQAMGLPVNDAMPKEVYVLMDLYPQPMQRRPSVQYIPVPYRHEPEPRPGSAPAGGKRPGGQS
jgi:ClpP class serine protease